MGILRDNVKETTAVVGVGAMTLLGQVSGSQGYAAAGDGATVPYHVKSATGVDWESGEGVYTLGTGVVTRDTVFASSNGGSLVVFGAGVKTVSLGLPASYVAQVSGKLSQFAATTSAELAGVISDETGSGSLVFSASPALTGTPTAPTAAGGTNTTQLATTAFVVAEVASTVTGLLDFKGDLDCSSNPNYPAAPKGDTYYVSVAGKVGGASGVSVDVGDAIVAKADNAGGTQAAVGTSWFTLEHNVAGALLSANNLSDVASAGTARTNLGATTVGGNIFTLANPSAVRFIRINANNTVDALSDSDFRAAIGAGTSSFSGVFADLTSKPTTLSGYGITDGQPLDATLTAFAGLTIAANSVTLGTGADAFSQITLAANTFLARSSSGNAEAKTITDFGLSLVATATAAAARSALGLGVVTYDATPVTVAANTVNPQNLMAYTFSSAEINRAGAVFRVRCGGYFTSLKTAPLPAITFSVLLGGGAFIDWPGFTPATNAAGYWWIDFDFMVISTGASASVQAKGLNTTRIVGGGTQSAPDQNTGAGTFDLTGTVAMQVRVAFATNASTSNSGTQMHMVIERLL